MSGSERFVRFKDNSHILGRKRHTARKTIMRTRAFSRRQLLLGSSSALVGYFAVQILGTAAARGASNAQPKIVEGKIDDIISAKSLIIHTKQEAVTLSE